MAAADFGKPAAITLYSLPQNAPLSSFEPPREHGTVPRWLRALLPEFKPAIEGDIGPRLIFVGVATLIAHALVFYRLHRRMLTEKMLRRAESELALPEMGHHEALLERALELATQADTSGGKYGVRFTFSRPCPYCISTISRPPSSVIVMRVLSGVRLRRAYA